MEEKKLSCFDIANWYLWASIFTCCIILSFLLYLHQRSLNSHWAKFSKVEQQKLIRNFAIWRKLTPRQRQRWQKSYKRYYKYSRENQCFLRQLHQSWQYLSRHQKRQRKRACKLFLRLSKIERKRIKNFALYKECFWFKHKTTPPPKITAIWQNFLPQPDNLPPLALRQRVMAQLLMCEFIASIPPHLQNRWKNLPIDKRMKIFHNLLRTKSPMKRRHLFFRLLKRERRHN